LRYISTRGSAPELGFEDVLLTGLARDGGLYVPAEWPRFSADDFRAMRGLSYQEIAVRVMRPFITGALSEDELAKMVTDTYAGFEHPATAPLKQLDQEMWLMELFHGPTLAFKDYAMQMLGRLFDTILTRRGERVTIVGATSGDTGSAAIEACRDRDAIDIFILFPKGRVSPVQQRQMTTVKADNVHAIALEGTFDDCQDMLKALFNDTEFRDKHRLSAVNSINWARLMAQIVYYVSSAVSLGAPDRSVAFSVPTGNFGNVFAAYAAREMGLPIDHLIIGSNRNDILARFLETGDMTMRGVEASLSPSMDIQVSSNFERLLFDMLRRDGAKVDSVMNDFRTSGSFTVEPQTHAWVRNLFSGNTTDDDAIRATIARHYQRTGEIIDPHTAVAVDAAEAARASGRVAADVPIISLACAHPAKFPDAVDSAISQRPALPERMADLLDREEHVTTLANDFSTVADFIAANVRGTGASA
jgi:threonine synthase